MSVKPITNPQVLRKENVNRAQQRSLRSATSGNEERSVIPGLNFGKGFSVKLKDIDTAVILHIKNTMKPVVREANEIIKIPVLYGNEERWKAVRKNGVLRDKNNVIILPIIVIRRSDIAFNDNLPMSFKHDVKGDFIKVVRANKWSEKNRYDRFAIQNNKNPVQEFITTGMPDFITCTYQIIVQTSYIEQMNQLNEIFLEHFNTYFGDATTYKFFAALDGSIADASEMAADGERIIRNEFSISINGYVLPEFTNKLAGKVAELQKHLSPSRVVFGFEGDATDYQIKKQ